MGQTLRSADKLAGIVVLLGSMLAACASSASPAATTPVEAATPAAAATPSPSPAASPSLTAVGGFFAISVADLAASEGWYEAKLGLEVAMRPPVSGGTEVVVLGGVGLEVELIHQEKGVSLDDIAPPLDDPTLLHGIVKAGVIVDDLDAAVALLEARNVPIAYGPYPATAEQQANLIIRDLEGNLIQLIAR